MKSSLVSCLTIAVILITVAFMAPVPAIAGKGIYREYSAENLKQTKDLKQVLFFFAPWCSGCVGVEHQLAKGYIPEGVAVLKVDYDSATELRTKYGVPYQGTFVQIDENGEKIYLWHGYASSIAANIK